MLQNDWLVIINPVSAAGKGARIYPKVLAALDKADIIYQHEVTEQGDHAIQLAKEGIERGYRKLIMVGGDGTVNEVVNGVLLQEVVPSQEVTLGMVGIGTGNDWIKTMKIPRKIEKAVEVLKKGNTRIIDAGKVTSTYDGHPKQHFFVNIAGLAFDASVVDVANAGKGHTGKWTYIMAVIKSLFTYKSVKIRLEVDGNELANEIIFNVAIGNGKYSGGGMHTVPDAIIDDGIFNIHYIREVSKWYVMGKVIKLFDGTYVNLPVVTSTTGKQVKVTSEEPVYVEVEGELLGRTPITVEMLPARLKVVVP